VSKARGFKNFQTNPGMETPLIAQKSGVLIICRWQERCRISLACQTIKIEKKFADVTTKTQIKL